MKKIFVIVLVSALLIGATLTALAAPSGGIYDNAGLLSDGEITALRQSPDIINMDIVALRHSIDIVILTTDDPAITNTRQYSRNFYQRGGYDTTQAGGGVILQINMAEREVVIETFGGVTARYTERGINNALDSIQPFLTRGDYYGAIRAFLQHTDRALAVADSGQQLGVAHILAVSAVIGLIVAALVLGILLLVHGKSLPSAPSHHTYMQGGTNVKHQVDRFVSTNTVRVPIPRNTGSTGGRGGGSTGGSRRF